MLFFLCCGSRKGNAEEIDENSRLIPTTEEPLPSPTPFDYGDFQARLGTIVRAKEGRMVNVNALGGPSYTSDYYDPVDSTSISQAYPEQQIPDIQAFRREASRSSSRSVERPRRTPSMALSAQLITLGSASPVAKEETKKAVERLSLKIGSLSRSWDD
ncbi:hypothetical protein BDZ89DRAFT_1164363 [Hymenopellis radicata]|nr:hypothetical protein BDZ89DRAFT_1164363 [Hymenopellis radicata]